MPILAVAPHWGAWIEIMSHKVVVKWRLVAPHWGAWIEITLTLWMAKWRSSRTPLGCVD